MKRFTKAICLILAAALVMSVPVSAATGGENLVSPQASIFFATYGTYLYPVAGTMFEIWFEVTSCGMMDELGVSSIIVQKSPDGVNWESVKTFTPDNASQMICKNTSAHASCIRYTGTIGYQYRAYVTFYAKKGTSIGKLYDYAYPL